MIHFTEFFYRNYRISELQRLFINTDCFVCGNKQSNVALNIFQCKTCEIRYHFNQDYSSKVKDDFKLSHIDFSRYDFGVEIRLEENNLYYYLYFNYRAVGSRKELPKNISYEELLKILSKCEKLALLK